MTTLPPIMTEKILIYTNFINVTHPENYAGNRQIMPVCWRNVKDFDKFQIAKSYKDSNNC